MPVLVIINPVSGAKRGSAIFKKVEHQIDILQKTVITSKKKGHIYDIAITLVPGQFEFVILIGGDGSLNEFINGMMNRADNYRIPVALLPAGTGNSLMHDFGLLKVKDALDKILEGRTKYIDIAMVSFEGGHHYAFNVVGWGLPSSINQLAENLKIFGSQRYNIASLLEIIRHPKWNLQLRLDDQHFEGSYSFFMACNTIHTGKGMKIAPGAKLDDGYFDLIMLKPCSRLKMISLFSKIFEGKHIESSIVEHKKVKKIQLSENGSSKLIIDGQVAGKTPFTMKVMPKEIEIFY